MKTNMLLFFSGESKILHEIIEGTYTRTPCSHADAISKAKSMGVRLTLHTGVKDAADLMWFDLYDKFDVEDSETPPIKKMQRESWIPID